MKNKLALFFTTLFVTLTTFAQDTVALKSDAEKVYQSTINLDYDAILEYTHPKVFEIVPKETMKEILITTFKGNEEMKIKILPTAPNFKFGEIIKIDEQYFCLINHNLSLELTIKEKIAENELEMMTDLFKSAMETDDITFNKEANCFTINKTATMIAISDKLTQNKWKFLNRDKKNILAHKIFTNKVIKELGL